MSNEISNKSSDPTNQPNNMNDSQLCLKKRIFIGLTYIVNFIAAASHFSPEEELGGKVDNLDATEDREAGEESHCPSNQANSANQGHLLIIFVFISFQLLNFFVWDFCRNRNMIWYNNTHLIFVQKNYAGTVFEAKNYMKNT